MSQSQFLLTLTFELSGISRTSLFCAQVLSHPISQKQETTKNELQTHTVRTANSAQGGRTLDERIVVLNVVRGVLDVAVRSLVD